MYKGYECNIWGITFIIPTEDLDRMGKANRYLACNFGHKNIKPIQKYGDLEKCMNQLYSRLI